MINRLAAERFLKGERAFAPPAPAVGVEEPGEPIEAEDEASTDSHFTLDEADAHAAQCAYCGGTLPAARKVNFCPHCGQPPSGELRCPACGSEVDVGWGYCASCGRPTGFE
jgi:predicted amidophosphoribosyltransferase